MMPGVIVKHNMGPFSIISKHLASFHNSDFSTAVQNDLGVIDPASAMRDISAEDISPFPERFLQNPCFIRGPARLRKYVVAEKTRGIKNKSALSSC